jgi:hypothetical protein
MDKETGIVEPTELKEMEQDVVETVRRCNKLLLNLKAIAELLKKLASIFKK